MGSIDKTGGKLYQPVQSVITGSIKRYAEASNRKEQGMYITEGVSYNTDAVGAFNILRKYLSASGKRRHCP